jgi:hypothetical protein
MLTHQLNHGRLGNQMFQIASTMGIASKNNQGASFPNWQYKNWWPKVNSSPVPITHHFYEQSENWYRDLTFLDNTCLHGYFQSEKYFEHIKSEIISIFAVEDKVKFKNGNTIGVHVRRGDYLNHGWWIGDLYYKKALSLFPKSADYIIFSDDYDWCKNFFPLRKLENIYYAQNYNEYECFELSKNLQSLIIANSSFSWWMAFLMQDQSSIIRPIGTFGDFPNKDFYPERWKPI